MTKSEEAKLEICRGIIHHLGLDDAGRATLAKDILIDLAGDSEAAVNLLRKTIDKNPIET